MRALITLAVEIATLALVFSLTNLAILAFRNPHRSQRLRDGRLNDLAAAFCVTALLCSLSFLGAGIYAVVPNFVVGTAVFIAVPALLYFGISRAMGMGWRVQACDAGVSPFGSRRVPPAGAQGA